MKPSWQLPVLVALFITIITVTALIVQTRSGAC